MPNPILDIHTVSPWATNSIGTIVLSWGFVISAPATLVYPAANLAIFIPFRSRYPFLCANAFWNNGTLGTVSNIDVGVYSKDGTRLWSTGSTAQSGASVIQSVDITDKKIGAGMYYIAIACDNAAGQLFASTFTNASLDTLAGIRQQSTAFPLPAVATLGDCTQTYLPLFGFTPRSVV